MLARFLATFATLAMVVLIAYQTYDVAREDYGMGPCRARKAGLRLPFLVTSLSSSNSSEKPSQEMLNKE